MATLRMWLTQQLTLQRTQRPPRRRPTDRSSRSSVAQELVHHARRFLGALVKEEVAAVLEPARASTRYQRCEQTSILDRRHHVRSAVCHQAGRADLAKLARDVTRRR